MNMSVLSEALRRVQTRLPMARPLAAAILGSGWSAAVADFAIIASVPYADIPGLGPTGVDGHEGTLVLAETEGRHLLLFQGRRHWYEGVGWEPIAAPVFMAKQMGAGIMMLCNAAGSIDPTFAPGDLMIIDDHINMMGVNPLVGPHDGRWGLRFPDLSKVYDPVLRERLDAAAVAAGAPVRHGVYVATSGPTYETPAEIAAFRRLGAQAVGMSTVPEAMLAHAAGLRVAGLSCITNTAAGGNDAGISHRHVLDAAHAARPVMAAVLRRFFGDLATTGAVDAH